MADIDEAVAAQALHLLAQLVQLRVLKHKVGACSWNVVWYGGL